MKKVSMPMGMLLKKHYCHVCGSKFEKLSYTNIITPDDPDYNEHRRTTYGGRRFFATGNIEVTEVRNFMCPNCGRIVSWEEQRIISNVQKRLKKRILAEFEIEANREKVETAIKRTDLFLKIAYWVVAVVVVALSLYFAIKTGKLSFKYYL